ncbi:protein transport protein HofC [Erwinia sp. CPCC 100877]|nr:protein transport protein HofC [Erwinia sp. CPCC 100877]
MAGVRSRPVSTMRLWRWQALDGNGQQHAGVMIARHRREVLANLGERSLYPFRLRTVASPGRRCWHLQQKIHFLRQLAALLQAGIALEQGCRLMAQLHELEGWRALLTQIAEQLAAGRTLSDTLSHWPGIFPSLFIALLRTGEQTGHLAECCERLAEQQARMHQLRQKTLRALRYPLFTLAVALLVCSGLVGFVLPEFAAIYQSFSTPLPALTQGVINVSQWLIRNGPILFSTMTILLTCWRYVRRDERWQDREQRMLMRLPLIAPLLRGQRLSLIHTTLALTQRSGIPLMQGLEAAELALATRGWRAQLRRVRQRVTDGTPFSLALAQEPIFTPLCVQLVRTGEESGTLDLMLEKLAEWHTGKTRELAEGLSDALEPVVMVIMGGLVGTLVLAMYLPVFRLGEAFGMG